MSNYWVPTVVHESIRTSLMAPLEEFLLKQVFNWEVDEDAGDDKSLYFFAEESPSSAVVIDDDLGDEGFRRMIAESRSLCPDLCKAVEEAWTEGPDLDMDEVGGYE